MSTLQDQIYEAIYAHCKLEFHDAFVRLEDGMRAKGHHPDLIHRLLQEDDYVWERSAKLFVGRIYQHLVKNGLELEGVTAEQVSDHTIKAMKAQYEKYQARISN